MFFHLLPIRWAAYRFFQDFFAFIQILHPEAFRINDQCRSRIGIYLKIQRKPPEFFIKISIQPLVKQIVLRLVNHISRRKLFLDLDITRIIGLIDQLSLLIVQSHH